MPVRVSTPVRNEFFRTERQLATLPAVVLSGPRRRKRAASAWGAGTASVCHVMLLLLLASHEIQRRLPCPREREVGRAKRA